VRQGRALGIEHRIRRFSAIETPSNHHIGCALSHRAILAEAKWLDLENVLILEDDVLFSRAAPEVLGQSLAELAGRAWQLCYLGGHRWGQTFPLAPGCRFLQTPHNLTGLHAVAVHRSAYDRILADVPSTPTAMARWLKSHRGLDQYLARRFDGISLVTHPSVATQPPLIPQESPPFEPLPLAG
jgi:hypothetical protein